MTARVELLLEWWETSGQDRFIDRALALLSEAKLDLVSSRDGQSLPELHWWVCNFIDYDHPVRADLLAAIQARLVEAFEDGMAIDDLIQAIQNVHEHMDDVPQEVDEVIVRMAQYEFKETRDAISHLDSEESLSEHLDYLDSLAELTGHDAIKAKGIVSDRLAALEEPDHSEYRPRFSGHGRARPRNLAMLRLPVSLET